jgi:hypothetical protein
LFIIGSTFLISLVWFIIWFHLRLGWITAHCTLSTSLRLMNAALTSKSC